jgi:type III pantothenate kinase
MNLLIDIGNTLVKLALADSGSIERLQSINASNAGSIIEFLKTKPKTDKCIVVRSGDYPKGWQKELNRMFPNLIELKHSTPLPLKINYNSVETLGMDRIAAAIGATQHFPGKNLLVIDAGTAITVDFVDDQKKYLGGNIIPGMSIRFKALHEHTDRLPLVQADHNFQLLGTSTTEAIRAGVLNGIIFELEGYIRVLENKYPHLSVVITGGDAEFLMKHLKSTIFIDLNLIFAGLNRILEYNADQDQEFLT